MKITFLKEYNGLVYGFNTEQYMYAKNISKIRKINRKEEETN